MCAKMPGTKEPKREGFTSGVAGDVMQGNRESSCGCSKWSAVRF